MRETRIGLVQSPLQVDLDRIAEDIIETLNADMALISVVNNNSLVSLGVSSTVMNVRPDRKHEVGDMVCFHVVKEDTPFLVSDARTHPETHSIGYVRAGLVSGYIGVPIQNAEVGAIGAICGVTLEPRNWSKSDLRYLEALSLSVENLILREMYRQETADAAELATEYDNIIAAFSLVRAEATSIHDREGRLVFANRALTQNVDDVGLQSDTVIQAFHRSGDEDRFQIRLHNGRRFVISRQLTGSGYWVCHWQSDDRRMH